MMAKDAQYEMVSKAWPGVGVGRLLSPGGGLQFLGAAAILYGVACFLQGDFAIYWQMAPPGLPFRIPLAYLSASLLVLGGAGLLAARTKRAAAIALLLLFAAYDGFALWALISNVIGPAKKPQGFLGVAEQTAVVIGCWAVLLRMRPAGSAEVLVARIGFGLCSIIFALAHVVALTVTANMVPAWLPGSQVFWAIATAVGHLAVAIALIVNRLAVPATRLGALMYAGFALLVWFLGALAHPTEWLRWAGVGISLCLAAALWLVGDLLAAHRFDPARRISSE